MSAPKKRDSTMLLLERYGDRLRQLARQSSVAEESKTDVTKSAAPVAVAAAAEPTVKVTLEEQPKPTEEETKESVVVESDSSSIKLSETPAPEVAAAVAETPQTEEKPIEEDKSVPAAHVEPEPQATEASTEEPTEKAAGSIEEKPDSVEPDVEDSTEKRLNEEKNDTPAVEPVAEPEPTKLVEKTDTIEETPAEQKEPEVAAVMELQPDAALAQETETKTSADEAVPVHATETQAGTESLTVEATITPSEPSETVFAEVTKEETTVVPQEATEETPKKKSRSKKSKEPVEESTQPEPELQPQPQPKEEKEEQKPQQTELVSPAVSAILSPVTSEILRVRWAMLLDRVEWTFGYSKLSNTAMKVEWDLEDGLDNVQGFTEVITLKEGEDYIDLNTKLRFTTSILARDLNAARFKPKIMTFTLYSEVDGSIMGSYELDLRTIMAPGRQDQELRYKLVDEETKKTRSTTPSLVIMLKRVKWETVIGDKSENKKVLEKQQEVVGPEEPEEAVLEEPKDKRKERLRREQSTRRRARKDAIDAEENGGESSPSAPSSPGGSSEASTPSGTPKAVKPRRGIKILRTNSRFETVEDVDK